MRFLILFLLATLLNACGVVRSIAVNTCTNGRRNPVICTGILDRMVPKVPAVTSPKQEIKCQIETKTWRKAGLVLQESTRTCGLK
jgi:hypothetical protein